jgi:hypothetical protein
MAISNQPGTDQLNHMNPPDGAPGGPPRTGNILAQAQTTSPNQDQNQTANAGRVVVLPNGQTIPDPGSPTGFVMSPVADLGPVAAGGRRVGATFQQLLSDPNAAESAVNYLAVALYRALGHGGFFDYQRSGNQILGELTGGAVFTQLPQFRAVANVNVGLFCQQAGLTLDRALSLAGGYARVMSNNSRPDQPNGLDPISAQFVIIGYNLGQNGTYGQNPAP